MKCQREELGNTDLPLYLHREVAIFTRQLYGQRFERGEIHTKGKDQIEIIPIPQERHRCRSR